MGLKYTNVNIPEELDQVVGDVYLRAGTLTAGAILKGICILRIVFAAPLLIFGIAFLTGGCSGLAKYKKIACAGNITPELLDSEANAKAIPRTLCTGNKRRFCGSSGFCGSFGEKK